MPSIPTVTVTLKGQKGGKMNINASDFDENIHERWTPDGGKTAAKGDVTKETETPDGGKTAAKGDVTKETETPDGGKTAK